jgi:uncharacterized protein (TIRG00374 family)
MIPKKAKQTAQFLLFFGLGVFLLWLTTRSLTREEINKVSDLVLHANLIYLLPCIGVLILSHYIRALRWKMLMDPLGIPTKIKNVFLSVLVGYFFNLVFPRLGEVMKCSLMGKYEKMPVDKLIGTMVAERMIDLICLVVVIVLTIVFQIDKVGSYAKELLDNLLGKANNALVFTLLLGVFFIMLAILYNRFKHSQWFIKIKHFFLGIKQGLFTIRSIKNKGLFFFHTFLIWFLYLLSIRVGLYSMSEVEHLSWVPSLTILTFGSFAMIATQGGIGAYQLAIQKTLTLYGINEVSGLAFGWLLWSVQTIMLLVTGPIALFLLFYTNQKKK